MENAEAAHVLMQAQAIARRVVDEAGLTVLHGETPTEHQARIAALHAREDAAVCMALLSHLIAQKPRRSPYAIRAARTLWWAGLLLGVPTFGIAALLFWPLAYVLGGTFWKPAPPPV